MENSEVSIQLLKKKYDLHKSPEVEKAARRTEARTGEKVPQDPLARIQNYLNRFHEILDQGDPERREHALDLIKGRFHQKYIIKLNEIPEDYFENQRRLAREQGHGDIEITPQMRGQLTEVIITDQMSSLDKWIDYLSSPDAPYSDGLKYWTLRSVLNTAEYDKERKMYPQRSKGTTKPFPDLNREALAYVLDAVEKKYKGQNIDLSSLDEKDAKEFDTLIKGENFAKLYAWALEKVTPASEEELSAVNGQWVKYNKGSDPMPLARSLQGHGTGWCTAGESAAQIQLQGGDFYVYYSMDKEGKPTIPRAAIRMRGGRIAEVRGNAAEQNLDTGAVAIVDEKLKEFPDGPSYQKKVADMRYLTDIENRIKEGQDLSLQDLVFLYEINSTIDGFGYGKDSRITKLRSQRNPNEDMLVVLGCTQDQIAHSVNEIRADTKAYVGPLQKGIFRSLKGIEHVYTSFPEERIRIEAIEIGGVSAQQLETELEQAKINVWSVWDMMRGRDFTTLKDRKQIKIVRLRVQDLGFKGTPTRNEWNNLDFKGMPTRNQLYAKAHKFGLDLCPAELGPHLRLKDKNQPLGEFYHIGMKPIADRFGLRGVFDLRHDDVAGLRLDFYVGSPGYHYFPREEFVFALQKQNEAQTLKAPGFFQKLFRR